jgi:RNA polymerase sigma-70 factor (ECF subfamily)
LQDHLAEQLLVLRCQVGDERAFEQIVAAYSSRLRYYLVKLIGNREAADDVLQDVWFDAYRGIRRLHDPTAFRAWIYRIARDRAYRLLRRARPQRRLVETEDLATGETDVEFTEEDAEQIHQALDTLSPEHCEVLLLRFIEELSYDEIASATRCSVGTVKSRIHYAKQKLRQTIEKELDDE